MKYIIVPKSFVACEVEADSPADAMIKFAENMSLDMNTYFEAVLNPREYKRDPHEK